MVQTNMWIIEFNIIYAYTFIKNGLKIHIQNVLHFPTVQLKRILFYTLDDNDNMEGCHVKRSKVHI